MINHKYYNVDEHIVRQFVYYNLDAITYANLEGIVQYVNPAAEKLYGYKPGELIGKHVDIFNSHKTHNTNEIINTIINKGGWSGDIIQARKNGESFHTFLSVTLIYNTEGKPIGYASNSHEITKRIENEKALQKALNEKEILLSEIHHRLKNNLAIISSMLQLQKININNKSINRILTDCQNRIKSSALVHEMLYQNDSLSFLDLKQYVKNLSNEICSSFSNQNAEVSIIGFNKNIDIEKAIACGFVITELMSNSIKHGISSSNGKIDINIDKVKDEKICLTYKDNGKGVDDDFNLSNPETTGLTLVSTFVEQLEGNIEILTKKPLCLQLTFPI